MKILHVCLASSYTEGMTYQDNMLSNQNVLDGHEVVVVSDCTHFVNGKITAAPPEDRLLTNGVRLTRLPFDFMLTRFISDKIRKTKHLKPLIESFSPDVVLFHGCCGWEMLTVAEYKKTHPNVKFYADSHEDFSNSARKFLSKNFLHKIFYKSVLWKAYPWVDKILYVSEESKLLLNDLYGLPDDKLEFYPLGGTVYEPEKRTAMREKRRAELGLGNRDILVCHSGKLEAPKRTEELVRAFSSVPSDSLRLIIIGSIPDEMKPVLEPLIAADGRIKFLGWKGGDELLEYLCACDLYAQPGSQSATLQNALCCGAPVMLYPHDSYRTFEKKWGMEENCYFVRNVNDMASAFRDILAYYKKLVIMGKNSLKFAEEVLDYRCLAARIYR
jgi:glycosyltransferase involved in cell wall biosynthesis